ncbi:MAG: peptidoglycan-binding protein [Ilumatobacteraceae bacterium]
MNDSKGFGGYETALQVADFWIENAELFLIEELHDYFPAPHGRGWRCDRAAWKVYTKPTIGSTPGGDWFHVEIAPAHADDPAYYESAFAGLGSTPPVAPVVVPDAAASAGLTAPEVPPGVPELSIVFSEVVREDVKSLQAILIARSWADFAVADGKFGNRTMGAVKSMQGAVGFSGTSVDGKYGPKSAAKLAEWLASH